MTCTVEGCDKAAARRGMCWMHIARVRRNGSTERPPRTPRPPAKTKVQRIRMDEWIEDVEWLLSMGECPAGLVQRYRLPLNTIIKRLERHGRNDLAVQLYRYMESKNSRKVAA